MGREGDITVTEQLAFSLAFYMKALFQGCYLNIQLLISKLILRGQGSGLKTGCCVKV